MRIGFDARAASHSQRGGFKTYTENLVRHLPLVGPENQYTFYVDRPWTPNTFSGMANVAIKVLPTRVPALGVIWREQVALPLQLSAARAELAHFPTSTASILCPCPFVVTIHDTIIWDEQLNLKMLRAAERLRRLGIHYYDAYLSRSAVRRAHFIITVSEKSKQDIVNRTGIKPEAVRTIYEAPAQIFTPEHDDETLQRLCAVRQITRPFILGLSSASPRKNTRGLTTAYAQLPNEIIATHQLVLVWTHHLLKNDIEHLVHSLGLQNRVLFLTHVGDNELRQLYSAASLFVFPSLYEGFGLPPLEAMACGTPVVASNISSLPEVLGDAALLVDPYDPASLSQAMVRALSNTELRASLTQRGFRQVAQYSWKRCAHETVSVYQAALGEIQSGEAHGRAIFAVK